MFIEEEGVGWESPSAHRFLQGTSGGEEGIAWQALAASLTCQGDAYTSWTGQVEGASESGTSGVTSNKGPQCSHTYTSPSSSPSEACHYVLCCNEDLLKMGVYKAHTIQASHIHSLLTSGNMSRCSHSGLDGLSLGFWASVSLPGVPVTGKGNSSLV